MRYQDYERIGPWATHSQPGGDYCARAKRFGYLYAWAPGWNVKHLCKEPSYNYRKQLVDGVWR